MEVNDLVKIQKEICEQYDYPYEAAEVHLKIHISSDIEERSRFYPRYAMRHPRTAESDSSGWYLWAGDRLGESVGFEVFQVGQVAEYCPSFLPYLGLPAGSKFSIDDNEHAVSVWFDDSLLENL